MTLTTFNVTDRQQRTHSITGGSAFDVEDGYLTIYKTNGGAHKQLISAWAPGEWLSVTTDEGSSVKQTDVNLKDKK